MFARFDENPAMILQDIKETKHYGRTDNAKTVYPQQTKFVGGGGGGGGGGGYNYPVCKKLTLFILVDFQRHVDTISIG